MLSMLGVRSFYAAAPCLWNSLPAELCDMQSLCNFKTPFFGQARTFVLFIY